MNENELKGYRIRAIVDYPIWCHSEGEAIESAKAIIQNSHSACKLMGIKIVLVGRPDNRELSPEELRENWL